MNSYRYLIIGLLLLVATICGAETPDLGSPSLAVLTPQQEQQLSRLFMRDLRKQLTLVTDSIVTSYLNTMGERIAATTKFHFFIVKATELNAFSGPAGNIGINSGLILFTRSESELAAVLAHEIAHTTQHHIARMYSELKAKRLPTLAALLAAIAIGAAKGAMVGSAAATTVVAGQTQSLINFTRDKEAEADRVGLKLLAQADFDPYAMPKLFTRMELINSNDTLIPATLQSHPQNTSRIADLNARLASYPHKRRLSSPEYYLCKARLRVLQATNSQQLLSYFKDRLHVLNKLQREANNYGYALALLNTHQFKAAAAIATKLQQQQPQQILYQLLAAKIALAEQQPQRALQLLHPALSLYRDYLPLTLRYATALLAAKQPQKATQFLRLQLIQFPNNLELYQLLSRTQVKSHDLAGAYHTRAKIFMLQGDTKMALLQLQQALKLPKLSADDRAILEAEIAHIKRNRV